MNKITHLLLSGVAATALLASASAYAQGEEVRFEPETYPGSITEFDVERFVGTVEIIVENRNTIEISAVGDAEHMDNFSVDTSGSAVEITYESEDFRWNDWSTWVSWWGTSNVRIEDYPTVVVRVPEGTPVDINRMTGNLFVGNLNGPFELGGVGALDARIGNVSTAEIDVAGAADVEMGDVAGYLSVSISGAGDLTAGSSARATIEIRGASDVRLGEIAGGLDVEVAGVGDVRAVSVNGPVAISLAGSGDVTIDEGRATRFDVSIAGAGDVDFGGTAVDPDISIAGSGSVRIEEYEGRLDHNGMGRVSVGS